MLKDANGIPQLVDDETGEILATAYWKTPYNHDREQESKRVGLECKDNSLTNQSFVEDADINNIMQKFLKTGELPKMELSPTFGDYNGMTPFEARTQLAEINAQFYLLPPAIRAEFKNEPAQWEAQVVKEIQRGNREALRELGFEFKEPPEAPKPPEAAGGTPAPDPKAGAAPTAPKAPSGA